ncbi:MAG: DUF481 domain-containing protein [Planctomycetaceae bacterium]|nr:DUF481 domain-containing protein [Planctomycetaceae bacterium]
MQRSYRAIRLFVLVSLLAGDAQRTRAEDAELELLPPITATEVDNVTSEATVDDILTEDVSELTTSMTSPSWTSPTSWFSSPLWTFGMELGINGSEGNSQAFSIVASTSAKRETEHSVIGMKLIYGKTSADGVETQNYGLFESRWDWNLSAQSFLYTKTILEYDEFKTYDLRLTKSAGFGHHLIKNDRSTLTGRFGAGASREFGGIDETWIPEANFGGDAEHALSARQKVNLTFDYFPAWENFGNYRVVSTASWEVLLDEATNLSLKIGAVDRYDSTPNGALANDIDYYVTLLWNR